MLPSRRMSCTGECISGSESSVYDDSSLPLPSYRCSVVGAEGLVPVVSLSTVVLVTRLRDVILDFPG